jgi:hypothetical protein
MSILPMGGIQRGMSLTTLGFLPVFKLDERHSGGLAPPISTTDD